MYGTNTLAQVPFAATVGNVFAASVGESLVAQDVLSAAVNFAVQFSDATTAADAVSAQFSIFSAVSEAAQGADTTSAKFFVGASVSEIATIFDVPTAIAAFLASTSEGVTASDSISSVPNYATQVAEGTQAFAFDVAVGVNVLANIAENTVGADVPSAIFIIPADIAETAVAADLINANAVFPAQLAESSTAQEQFLAKVNFKANLSEVVTARDVSLVAAQTFVVSISEVVRGLDAISSRELWEQINDTQIPGWADILVPVVVEDIAVFGGGNFGTLAFAGNLKSTFNPNPAVWNEIDDTQTTTWVNIVAV